MFNVKNIIHAATAFARPKRSRYIVTFCSLGYSAFRNEDGNNEDRWTQTTQKDCYKNKILNSSRLKLP